MSGPSSSPGPETGRGLQALATLALRFLLVAAAVYVVILLLNAVSLVTITITVAVMISALLQPGVAWLVARGLPRPLSALLVFAVGVLLIFAAGYFVVVQVTANSAALGSQVQAGAGRIQDWLAHGPLHVSQRQLAQYMSELVNTVQANKASLVGSVYGAANSALTVLSGLVFCLFATLFMLFDDGAISRWLTGLFPRRVRPAVADASRAAWRTLTAYMRSLVLLALINALTMVVVMLLVGMPFVVPLGVLLFLGALIPLIGILVAGVAVVLVALVTKSLIVAIVVAVALFLTVQLEGNLLNPLILGRAVQLHPLAILITVTAGTLLGGIFGAFVAVPFVAVVNNVGSALRRTEDRSPPSEPPPLAPDRHQEADQTARVPD